MSFDTARFITEIEIRACLWNSALTEYADRDLKNKSWEELVDIFKEKDDMTIYERKQLGDALQKKWKSIRGCFTREINRQKTLKSGSGTRPRKSEYVFFQQLQFLKDFVATREPGPVTTTVGAGDKGQLDKEVKTRKRIKREESSTSEDDNYIEVEINKSVESNVIHQNHQTPNEDEDRLFMLSLVDTLKKVPPHMKMATKIQIMSVLDEATRNVAYYNTNTS